MSTQAAEHHVQAAEHHEHAARHHREAAKHQGAALGCMRKGDTRPYTVAREDFSWMCRKISGVDDLG